MTLATTPPSPLAFEGDGEKKTALRRWWVGVFLAGAAFQSRVALADDLVTKGDGGVLAVRVGSDGIVARSCKSAKDCSADGGTTFRPPAAVRANLGSAKVRSVRTSRGKELAAVSVPGGGDKTWMLLLAPGGEDDAPRIVWSGYAGGGSGNEVTFEKDGAGEKLHVVTHLKLCERSILGSDRALDPASLELKAKAMPDPVADVRKTAPVSKGELAHRPGSASGPRAAHAPFPLLRATGASSGTPAQATDGDRATTWHPDGAGYEALTLSAPETVAATGLRIAFDAEDKAATPPRSLMVFLGTDAMSVELPDATRAGDEVVIAFSAPIHARCVGVVVGPAGEKHGRLDVSEVELSTALDSKSLEEIAKGLDGSDAGRAKADLLAASGEEGFQATARAYPALDGGGQESARRVIDAASCDDKLAFYVPLLAAKDGTDAERAHERVEQCGKAAVAPLVAKIASERGEARAVFAEELGLVAPDEAMPALIDGLAASDAPADRLIFRRGLVKAGKRQRSVQAFDAALASDRYASLSPTTQIDLLRGMGPRIGETQGGAAAFEKLWKTAAGEFRARYLLLQPAAELALKGAPFARETLEGAIAKDADDRIRAHAADVVTGNKDFTAALTAAAADKDPRVREASQRALATLGVSADLQRVLATALGTEAWTFVKRASLAALAGGADDAGVDATLAKAIDVEEQPIVRSDILNALGARGAKSARDAILARAGDEGEALFVRVAALEALGGLCDMASLVDLTKLAQKGRTAGSESEAKLAMAAIAALGRLHPSDIDKRLAPDLAAGVIADVRASARAAIAEEHTCKTR